MQFFKKRRPVIRQVKAKPYAMDITDPKIEKFSFRKDEIYVNQIGADIKVISANGVEAIISSGIQKTRYRGSSDNNVSIRVGYGYDYALTRLTLPEYVEQTKKDILDADMDIAYQLKSSLPALSASYEKDRDVLEKSKPNHGYGVQMDGRSHWFWIEYLFDETTLIEAGGHIYIPSLDIVVGLATSMSGVVHPRSPEGIMLLEEEAENRAFKYHIEIIDPFQKFGDRYVNINGEVYHIRAKANKLNYSQGVYVYHGLRTSDIDPDTGYIDPTLKASYYTLEDAKDKLPWLYATVKDAEELGNASEVKRLKAEREALELKQLLEKTKHENALAATLADAELKAIAHDHQLALNESKSKRAEAEKELEELKEKLERERVFRDQQLADQKRILEEESARRKDHYERESQARKDKYEERSFARKAATELIKWLPAIVAGILILVKRYGDA